MAILSGVAIIFCLGVLIYQDFKYRTISAWLLFISLILAVSIAISEVSSSIFLNDFITNIIFIIIQLSIVSIYFSVRHRKLTNIFNSYLGLGDVLFLLLPASLFSPLYFVIFYVFSLILTLIGYVGYKLLLTKQNTSTIPLAGFLSFFLILCFSFKLLYPDVSFHGDFLIKQLFL